MSVVGTKTNPPEPKRSVKMNYRKEIYYQEKEGVPHRKVTKKELEALIGKTFSSWLLSKAEYRIQKHPEIWFEINGDSTITKELALNDGFGICLGLLSWFTRYDFGKMAILHFTDFRY